MLEQLNRAEGGFKLQVEGLENQKCDANDKIRQLRWSRRRLIQHQGCNTFEDWEIQLLFWALQHVYGDNYVFLEDDDELAASEFILK